MTVVIRTRHERMRSTARLFALGALLGLLAAAALSLAPAAAEGDLDEFELILSIAEDSDNIVPAGSEIQVRAALRFPWQTPITPPAGLPSYAHYTLGVPGADTAISRLRVSAGGLEWEENGRKRIGIPAQTLFSPSLPLPSGANQMHIKAFDKRTLVLRSNNRDIYIFDSYTLEHKATLNPPPGTYTDTHSHNKHFGASVAWNTRGQGAWIGKALDIWHETDDRAWLFVGSWADTASSRDRMGRLFRYRLDWDDDGVTVTPQGVLSPPLAEADNRHGTALAQYGGAVSFSRDGGTLAVSAPRMNMMGAVYVYSRPDGNGEDWGDLEYADGVKVTVGAVPSFGTSTSNMPFLPGTAYDASTPRSCDLAWCSLVWSSVATQSYDGVDLGSNRVSLSADGSVLVVGAAEKEYAVTTPGGGFTNANRRDNAGEAFVFLAPEGGWQNAPRADRDADGNAKTLIAAKTDASSFRRATHYSPGPLRRVTEPAAVLVTAAWPNPGSAYFGYDSVVSQDGSTVAVANWSSTSGAVYIFQRDSAGDWASLSGGYMTPSATLSGLTNPSLATMHFSLDGSELAVGQPTYSTNSGALRIFSRPADGTWVSAGAAAARLLQEADGVRNVYSRYGHVTPELSGTRTAIGTQSQFREYLTSPAVRGCALSVVDGVPSATCPLNLPDSTIAIPDGTPDGTFTILGSVTLEQDGSGAPARMLTDTLEVTIGEVDELAEVKLDFATDASTGRPWPSVVEPGGSTTLLLQLLNENGAASAKGAAASVLTTTTRGGLSGRLGSAGGEACAASGGQSCRIANPATALTADNANQIRLTVAHPGAAKAGVATIQAVVVNAAGRTLQTEPLTVTFSGAPAALAITPPPTALLGYAPSESTDPRNKTTLVVSASDQSGNRATVPSGLYSAKLTDPDGRTVTSRQAELVWPLRVGGDADDALALSDGNPQARLTILADAASPLATGEYTLELSAGPGAGKLTATQTLVVTGGAADLALSVDPMGEVEESASITVTATVTDAAGAPVPDGTPVHFTEEATGSNAVLVLVSQSRQLTSGGQASVVLRAVSSGGAYVKASADGVAAIEVITVVESPPPTLEQTITSLAPGGFTIWTSAQETSASALYALLQGVAQVRKWNGIKWISYGETAGRLNPGSFDFLISRGAILWLDEE